MTPSYLFVRGTALRQFRTKNLIGRVLDGGSNIGTGEDAVIEWIGPNASKKDDPLSLCHWGNPMPLGEYRRCLRRWANGRLDKLLRVRSRLALSQDRPTRDYPGAVYPSTFDESREVRIFWIFSLYLLISGG